MAHIIGYYGIVIPQRKFFQGFYLDEDQRQRAVETLALFRGQPDMLKQIKAIRSLSDVATEDQGLLGGLCSGAVATALTADPKVTVFAMCISIVIRTNYFWIKAGRTLPPWLEEAVRLFDVDESPEAIAAHTTIERIPADSVEMAQTMFGRLPEVTAMRQETS